ncbi:hypothetical protein PMAYCL1PPCAC_10184, partial [Pristionchus mayeri]
YKKFHFRIFQTVIESAEKFVIDSERFSNTEKLIIADQYRLYGLQEIILSGLKQTSDFKAIKASPVYSDLSRDIVSILFEHLLQVAQLTPRSFASC